MVRAVAMEEGQLTEEEEAAIGFFHAPQESCEGCPFGGPRVGSKGNPRAPIVFVAESPGIQELRQGKPLVGPSGRIFHNFVPEATDTGAILVLNAMECMPSRRQKDADTVDQAASCCRKHLLSKIREYPRRIVVAMGNPAVRSLTGDWNLKITQIRGRLIPSDLSELGIFPMIHIAALMRGTGSFRQWREDIEYAMDLGLGAEPKKHIKPSVEIIPEDVTQEDVDDIFQMVTWDSNKVTCDIETTGFDFIRDEILSVGVTPDSDPGINFCFLPRHLPLIKQYLESEEISWNWHNGKFDIKFLRVAGIHARVDDDTMLMSYAMDETGGVHDLETVSGDVLDAPDYKHMLKPYLPNKKASYANVPLPVLAEYQGIDVSNTSQIRTIYRKRVRRDPALERLYSQTLLPASEMLTWVEMNGFYVDQERLQENGAYYVGEQTRVSEEINEILGYSINVGSPKQVSEALFKRLKMPDKAKGSTAEAVLEKLQKLTKHPIIGLILEHRKAVKMNGTYVKGVQRWLHPDTSRVHATYLLHGTRTGRLASREPNMQNVPRLAQIRGQFTAAPGYELVEVDLSQAELRSLAALSGDPELCRVYNSGEDLHSDLARDLFPGWDDHPKDQKKEERVKCKNVNFGIVYGITEFGLMEQIGDLQESKRMLTGWYKKYSTARNFIERCRKCPIENRVITTCFGRRKRVGLVARDNLNFLMNEAANFPHQSIASDITLHAAIRIMPTLKEWGVKIVNLVHDSIIMEVPISPDNIMRRRVMALAANELRQVPVDWGITQVPFEADAEYGQRWGSLQEYKGDVYNADKT